VTDFFRWRAKTLGFRPRCAGGFLKRRVAALLVLLLQLLRDPDIFAGEKGSLSGHAQRQASTTANPLIGEMPREKGGAARDNVRNIGLVSLNMVFH
jgi:hypothetical protein